MEFSDRNPPQLVKTELAAILTGLSASTLNKLRVSGGGPAYIKLGRSVLYARADLDCWLEASRRSSTSVACGGA